MLQMQPPSFFFAKFWYCNTSDIKWPGGMLDMFKNWDLGIGNHKISNGCTSIDWKRWLERWPNLTQVLCRQLTFTVPKVRNNFWIQNFVENQKSNWDCCNGMRQEWVFLFFLCDVIFFMEAKQRGAFFFRLSFFWSKCLLEQSQQLRRQCLEYGSSGDFKQIDGSWGN